MPVNARRPVFVAEAVGVHVPPTSVRISATALAALSALAGVALVLYGLSGLVGVAPPPPKNPFGVGIREGAAPSNALVAWILATQSDFYRQLTAALREAAARPSLPVWLIALSFAYGVFHAAGPGHGKAVIGAWIVANELALRRGLAMAFGAAMLQAGVAVALVAVLSGLLQVTAMRMTAATESVELASFAFVAAVGAALLWRKASALAASALGGLHYHAQKETCGPECGHLHIPGPAAKAGSRRAALGAVFAAGMRPCSGAIIVLVFALSQRAFGLGVAATLAMAMGTALTTGGLAALAVLFKGAALRLATGRGRVGAWVVATIELGAAALLLTVGLALFAGVWSSAGG
ncbi:nickel/cobalt transporter [Alsobacter sp. SYSU M60028]|uniref:Nickel/cobalt efflux system n=1 Tax=Alsobacter ponti TaxID=2962936 RepID=A0ABT1L8E9_9HYPH|nr:nickel/cobalt transporter [Alsobacter ponti]MCP8937346.1 nickel/cobalt transporter [Alsobacter ponti]